MIGIRADANKSIATGHISRCLSIASALNKLNQEVLFISADDNPKEMVEENGFSFVSLNSNWDKLNEEADVLLAVIKEYDINCLLIDSYNVTIEYLRVIRKHVRIAYIDDVNLFKYPVDILINYNLFHEKYEYKKNYSESTELLLGTDFVPLRDEFIDIQPNKFKQVICDVLITSGGTDQYNICGEITQKLLTEPNFKNTKIHIIVGRLFLYKEFLRDISEKNENVILHENAMMSEIMQKCDIAISAGGSTFYELCSFGIPTILFSLADNQLPICYSADEQKVALFAGKYDQNLIDNISSLALQLKENEKMREMLWNHSLKLVDGNGAKRLAERLICLSLIEK